MAYLELKLGTIYSGQFQSWCIWLKGVMQAIINTQRLLEIQEYAITMPSGIKENLMTLTAPIELSSFLFVLRCYGSIFSECTRFPYQYKTINKWFTHSADDMPGRVVNIINVDNIGRKSKCYTTQNGVCNFPESLLNNDNYEIFFHGTRHESVQSIMDGIDLAKGQPQKDFSDGDGFYLGNTFADVWTTKWARNRPPCSAVLVFRVRKAELREDRNGLNLWGKTDQWKELVGKFRTGKANERYLRDLEEYQYIEGPLCGEGQDFNNNPTPDFKTHQLCVRSDQCAELFDRSLHSVVFFEQK